jgi:copper chaperone NosL
MKLMLDKFYDFLSRPLFMSARFLLVALVVPLVLSFSAPLWRISMTAPQYPNGLYMDVYAYKLEGGNNGQHITEINTLNHYIGMHHLDRTAAADLDWIPFALGFLAVMALRVAAVGAVRDLVDLVVMTAYVSAFAFGRFVYRLYVFGHDLAADAPVKVKPFMPVVLGHKTVANFETYSYPQTGSYYLTVFVLGVGAVLLWHLAAGRRQAVRAGAPVGAAA